MLGLRTTRGAGRAGRSFFALGMILIAAVSIAGAQVVRHPDPAAALADRAAWAAGEAARSGAQKGFWIGYGIRRLMGEHSQFCMGAGSWGRGNTALDELIYGHRTLVEKRAANARPPMGGNGDEPERKVVKEVALLLKYDSLRAKKPSAVSAANLMFSVSLEGLPLYWLGEAGDEESVRFLIGFSQSTDPEEFRSGIIHAVGLHRKSDLVVPFLEKIVAGKEAERFRADAASFLGEQPDPRSLEILKRTIANDPSSEVRESAVAGLIEMELPAAAGALIEIAERGKDDDVRNEAIHGLAEKATKETMAALERLTYKDKDIDVRMEAVRAAADLPQKGGLPFVIKAAKTHPDKEVRIAAIEALGEFRDPAAFQALLDIVKKRG